MGNCGTKPATNEGETPAPEQKEEEIAVESRGIVVGEEETKVINEDKLGNSDSSTQQLSLGQLIIETEAKVTEEGPTSSETTLETKEVTAIETTKIVPKKEAEPGLVEEEKQKHEEKK